MDISATISRQTRQANNTNTLAFCVDENYLPYALFVAEQFIHLHPEMPCDICICLPDMSKVPEKFKESKIRFIELSINGIESLPIGQLSLATYHRLFLPQVFESTYEYIIYLDADTYINKPFYKDLLSYVEGFQSDFCVAASADIVELNFRSSFSEKQKSADFYIKTYHQFDHIYRNAGVLVFNTKNCVEQDVLSRFFSYAIRHSNSLQCHDQSVLNGTLLNSIALLPFDFNWQINKRTYKFTESINPYIIHFISNNKPWRINNEYTRNYQTFYKDFLSINFSEVTTDILTTSELRRITPKYTNPIKEFISREGQRVKGNVLNALIKKLNYPRDKYGINNILIKPPFLVSVNNTRNVKENNNN